MRQNHPRRIAAGILAIAGTAATVPAQGGVTLFLGDPGGIGSIQSFAEGSGQLLPPDPELQAVRLLPVDFNGRLAADALRPDRPRYSGDLPGAGRIRLPNDGGVLYRHERVPGVGPHLFGFLLVDPQGGVHRFAEIAGTGPAGDQDPYLWRIGIAPDGRGLLAGTTVAAGGDLLEIDLSTGAVHDRTVTLPPLEFRERSLMLAGDWTVAVCSRAVLRSGRLPADTAKVVPIGGVNAHFTGEVVLSPTGAVAMTTAGRSALELHAWIFGPAGSAVRATRDAGRITGAGFLPESPHGPFLAVSDDGVLCGWRERVEPSHELFMRRTDAPPGLPATQITSDARYLDTLDEIGFLTLGIEELLFAVGEFAGGPGAGIEKADFFGAKLGTSGAPTIRNISMTSGEATPPFLTPPAMAPLALRWVPAAGAFLMHDEQSGGGGRLVSVTPAASGVQVLLDDVKDVDFVESVGTVIACSLRRSTGQKPHQLALLPQDLSVAANVVFDGGDASLLQPVAHPTDWIAFVETPELGPWSLHRLRLPGFAVETSAIHPGAFGPVAGLSPSLDLAFSFDASGLRRFAGWPSAGGVPYRLLAPSMRGAVMPGR